MIKKTLLLVLGAAALGSPVLGQEQQSQQPREIIVTGHSLDDTLRALQDCLERGCPPEEDMKLSLRHAENQFLSGEYKGSRETIRDSLGRNEKYADELPVPVSDLERAQSRIAEHLGEAKEFQLATLNMRDTLEQGLGENDPRTLAAEVTVGDSRAKLGHPDDAERIYKRVEERALEAGQPRVAMYARVRQALLMQARYDATKQQHWQDEMVDLLHEIQNHPLEGAGEFSLVAEVILAKLDREEGDEASTEALVKRFAESGGVNRPVLLFSKPMYGDEDLDREAARASTTSALLSTKSRNKPQWADVGFWINPDGHVDGIEILRSEGDAAWLKQVLRQIDSRIYAPLASDGAPGFYMIERYTLTARFTDRVTGTRMRKREPTLRIERLDITPDNYGQPIGDDDLGA